MVFKHHKSITMHDITIFLMVKHQHNCHVGPKMLGWTKRILEEESQEFLMRSFHLN